MSYGYSDDLRKAALDCYDRGGRPQAEVCEIFGIALKTFSNWLRQRRETGTFLRRACERERSPYKLSKAELAEYIAAHPDAYLKEIAQHFSLHPSTIHYACIRFGMTRKKNRAVSGA